MKEQNDFKADDFGHSDDENIYGEIGFRCGLEIHQRLDTGEKLFCSCSTSENSEVVGSVSRMQRAVAGELGKMDLSAEFEEKRKRRFLYNIFKSTSCLVDIDEEPPHGLNNEALIIALAISNAMHMKFVDEPQIMRKGVVDGSDPSAFQRTMLLGFDGRVKVGKYDIKITSVSLEEESSRIESGNSREITYNVDRLGIPLIEIDTDSDIKTPKLAKEIASYIGTLFRMTGKVKRGIGTIRQDVNISIKGGARVEIKGLQELSSMDKFIENEVKRQKELIEISKMLKNAGAKISDSVDITGLFANTSSYILKRTIENGGRIIAFKLGKFGKYLGKEINPNRRLGTEISDYVKTVGIGGIIHSSENLDNYGFSESEKIEIARFLGIGEDDAFIIIGGGNEEVMRASKIAIGRANAAIAGVPEETRGAINDGSYTSMFLRPLPSGSRMYPETDIKPVLLNDSMLEEAKKLTPDMETELNTLEKQLGDRDTARRVMLSQRYGLYKEILNKTDSDPKFVANVLLQKFVELNREKFRVDNIDKTKVVEVFQRFSAKKITKLGIEEILKKLSEKQMDVDVAIKEFSLERISGSELDSVIKEFKKKYKNDDVLLKKEIMKVYRLNIDGSELNSAINNQKK